MFLYSYAYLFGTLLIYLPVFLILFLWRKDLRKEMIIAGLVFGIIAFLTEPIFISYYWHPQYLWPLFIGGVQIGSFEDFQYGFLIGGVASVLYEEMFHKTFCKICNHKHHWKKMIAPIYVASSIMFLLCTFLLNISPIYSSLFSILIFGIYLILYRKDLLMNALLSGALLAGITYIGYIVLLYILPDLIQVWWEPGTLGQFYLSHIPAEELLAAYVIGFFGGPFYEFFNGIKLKDLK